MKVDSGFGRNGFTPATFDAALAKLVPLAKEGVLHIVGQWSHLAVADAPDVPEFVASTDRQVENFKDFTRRMEVAGIAPEIRHLANTAATLSRPEIHFELTRPGIGLYGYEADPAMGTPGTYDLTPAMTLQAQLGTVKDVEAGHGISYGRTYLTPTDTSTAIVPVGYADGIHRSASGFDMEGAKHVIKPGGPVRVMTTEGPRLYRVSGRVCMDQFMLDLHGSAEKLGVHEGDTVQLFGPGRGEDYAEPTADDWGLPQAPSATRSSPVCATAFRACTSTPPTCCRPRISPNSIPQPFCKATGVGNKARRESQYGGRGTFDGWSTCRACC